MKHTINHQNAFIGGPAVPIHFRFTHPTAHTVCLAGTFNNWHPAYTMRTTGDGEWWNQTTLAPGIYEYCLVVDGEWMADPRAQETVPNPYGGRNSILRVASTTAEAHLVDAENAPMENSNL